MSLPLAAWSAHDAKERVSLRTAYTAEQRVSIRVAASKLAQQMDPLRFHLSPGLGHAPDSNRGRRELPLIEAIAAATCFLVNPPQVEIDAA